VTSITISVAVRKEEPLQAWKAQENELGSLNPRRKDICALGSDEFFEQVDSE